jgi:hypothetical protein
VQVKLLAQQGELYVLAHSADRVQKERARRQLKWLWARLKQLSAMTLTREQLLMKLGGGKAKDAQGLASNRNRGGPTQRLVDLSPAPAETS